MFDTQTQALLQEIFRREGQSFLNYIHDAFPWTSSEGLLTLERLQRLSDSERTALAALGRFLLRQRVPVPFLGSFPMNFTSFNFMSLESLIPKLIDAQKQLLSDLERDLAHIADPVAKAELTKLADLKRLHLEELHHLLPPLAA